jgi:primosomal protein N''
MGKNIKEAIKKAKAEALRKAKPNLAAVRLSATYDVLVRDSDLSNPQLSEPERLRRAEHLVKTYKRLRKVDPDFHDDADQLRLARKMINKRQYERRKAKRAALRNAELAKLTR